MRLIKAVDLDRETPSRASLIAEFTGYFKRAVRKALRREFDPSLHAAEDRATEEVVIDELESFVEAMELVRTK